MICRTCGTEIADKAIVCYRCGTGTADPVRKPAEIRRRRPGVLLLVILLVLVLLGLFLGYEYHVFGVEYHVFGIEILIDFPAIHV